jgi:hypothetical protein
MDEDAIDRDELVRWLRLTEEKLGLARLHLKNEQRRHDDLPRRSRGRAKLAASLATKRAVVEGIEATLALGRAELGEGPIPDRCFRTFDGELRCELPFQHGGLHQATPEGQRTRRRWE